MNRVCFEIDKDGQLVSVATDEPIECYIVAPHCARDRVYLYGANTGPDHVSKLIGGFSVGHADDGTLGELASPRLPPSKPALKVV